MTVDRHLLIILTVVAGLLISLAIITRNEHRRFDRAERQVPAAHQPAVHAPDRAP